MQPNPVDVLTALGLGHYAAGILALLACAGYLITWIAPLLPAVPPTGSVALFVFNVIHAIAANVGGAKNASAMVSPLPAPMPIIPIKTALLALFATVLSLAFLSACTAAKVEQAQANVNTACALAPLLDAAADPVVKADVALACADEQTLAPAVAPLITKP